MTAIDDFTRLKHIADACQEALDFIKGITRQELENDRMLSLALVKELDIIGEAANHISSELKNRHPDVSWQDMIGMRNRLVHVYFGINYDIVWQTITENLPILLAQINDILKLDFPQNKSL